MWATYWSYSMKNLVFYYFGVKITYDPANPADVGYHYGHAKFANLSPALQNEILYRLQEGVFTNKEGTRTVREVFDTRRGKWTDVLVPMLVNMQAETSKVVEDALYGIEHEDVPY